MWTLNFGSHHIPVPWQIGVAVLVLGIALGIAFAVGFTRSFYKEHYSDSYYACSWCGHRFKPDPKKLRRSLLTNDERVMKCPKCGKVDYCGLSYNQDDK